MEQALQTAPIGATVILGEDIRASGVLDANEAVRKLGGVAARSDLSGGREASLDLRGFGDTAANNTVVMVDGIRISENEQASARLSAISPDMIERIEIIRGGASVVWGEGATSGVINVITKTGKKMGFHGSVSLGLESFSGRDKRVDLNYNAAQAKLFLQARDYSTDGYRDNSGNANQSLNFGVEVGSNIGFKARFTVFSDELKSRLAGALSLANALANPTQTKFPLDNSTQKEDRKVLALQYREGGLTLGLDLAKRERESTYFEGRSYGDTEYAASGSQTQTSPRISYTKSLGAAVLTTVGGLDYSSWDYKKQTFYSGFLGGNEVSDQKNKGKYIKSELLLASQTRIVAGYRKESISKKYADPLAFSPVSFANEVNLKAWELGVNQTLAAGLDAYVRTASSFRNPNVDDTRYLALPTSLRPQISKDFELGLKYLKAGTSLGVRVFQQKTRDEIAYDNNTFSNTNLDDIRRKGIELEGRTQLNSALGLSGSIQSLSAQFTEGANIGKTPPHVSKLNISARLDYAFTPAHNASLAMVRRSAAVMGNDWSNSCSYKTPAKTTLDALYRYRSGTDAGWVLTAGVDNLTNAKSYSWGYTNAACSAANAYPEPGRSLKVSAKYLF